MDFETPLVRGRLVRRYQRFLADVRLDDGTVVVAHTPNTGRMTGCLSPESEVWLSRSARPGRRYPFTWEIACDGVTLVGIHTGRANRLAEEAIQAGQVPALAGYDRIRREVRFGTRSRVDLLLERLAVDGAPMAAVYVEVKNVTLVRDGLALFPDAVTARGLRHLHELMAVVAGGGRAAMVFVVQRMDAARVFVADDVDPAYGEGLRRALDAGVEVFALRFRVSPEDIVFDKELPFEE